MSVASTCAGKEAVERATRVKSDQTYTIMIQYQKQFQKRKANAVSGTFIEDRRPHNPKAEQKKDDGSMVGGVQLTKMVAIIAKTGHRWGGRG